MKWIAWHAGPPPHVGWWNASNRENYDTWRWWDGIVWSCACIRHDTKSAVADWSSRTARTFLPIRWNDSWPKNARVPRIDPRVGGKS